MAGEMPDPRVLYVVTAVVVVGLVAWVIAVLLRPANNEPRASAEKPPQPPPGAADAGEGRSGTVTPS
jgi:hypothetical protein